MVLMANPGLAKGDRWGGGGGYNAICIISPLVNLCSPEFLVLLELFLSIIVQYLQP